MRRLHSGSLTVKRERERQCFAGVTETRQDNDESLEKRGGWAKQINRLSGTRKDRHDETRRHGWTGKRCCTEMQREGCREEE